MNSRDRHPSRRQMLEAIAADKVPFRSHLQRCQDCSILFQLLSEFELAGAEPMVPSDQTAVAQLVSIAKRQKSTTGLRMALGRLTADSWNNIPALQLRNVASGVERRLRFQAGRIALEIVAERNREGWEFTARAYNRNRVTTAFVIKAGHRKFIADSSGFYYWSSERPPSTIQLLSDTQTVDFKDISWLAAFTS